MKARDEAKNISTPKNIPTKNLLPFTKVWSIFILSSFMPVIHSSTIAIKRAELIFAIVNDFFVDVGKVINSSIKAILKSKADSLAFPGVLALLCKDAGVDFADFREQLKATPPITATMIKEIYTNTPVTAASSLPTKFKKESPLKLKSQLQKILDRQESLAARQDALHESQKAGLLLMDTVMMNIGQKLGMTKEQLYESEAQNVQCLRATTFNNLPLFIPGMHTPPRENEEEEVETSSEEEEISSEEEDEEEA